MWYVADSACALGQLVPIDYSDVTPDVVFTYDRLGRQLTVTDVLGTRTNVYNALNLLEERHPDGAGGIGGILACTYASGEVYYSHADIMGNVIALTDASGSVVATFRYTPFGQLSARTGSVLPRYLFSSKEFDRTANLYYYGYRYYAPRMGRWMNRDRLDEADGPNIYTFIQNDSVNWLDDTGLRRRRWGNLAGAHRFIWHFYTGDGASVNIGNWGYLDLYRSASDVQVFECEARNEARASVDDCCAGDGTQWNSSYTRLVDGTDGLYVMGKGHPKVDWNCAMNAGAVTCDLSYNITDSFEDPVDLESHVNHRLPGWAPRIPDGIVNLGGTPYPLTASWEDTVDGCSEPEDCSAMGGGRRRRR